MADAKNTCGKFFTEPVHERKTRLHLLNLSCDEKLGHEQLSCEDVCLCFLPRVVPHGKLRWPIVFVDLRRRVENEMTDFVRDSKPLTSTRIRVSHPDTSATAGVGDNSSIAIFEASILNFELAYLPSDRFQVDLVGSFHMELIKNS